MTAFGNGLVAILATLFRTGINPALDNSFDRSSRFNDLGVMVDGKRGFTLPAGNKEADSGYKVGHPIAESAAAVCYALLLDFFAGSPTSQEALRQVGSPSLGSSHWVSSSQTTTNRTRISQLGIRALKTL